ncbi:MAG: RNA 2',3'-cyclic phosphodiesterase [Gammaproteobacteria bacterium]|nr:RNA 2',3'-cyclic phosphodiesterase [Gammaproteobacteria bacterium]
MAEARRERLFFALWPDPDLRSRLATAGAAALAGSGRLVPPERIHLTLAFVGDVDKPVRQCLLEEAGRIAAPAFTLVLDRLGWWRRSQVLWVGTDHGPAGLAQLVAEVHRVCGRCDVALEARAFATHVTLARKVRRAETGEPPPGLVWSVGEFALVRSVTGRDGLSYTTVATWPLAEG